MGVFSKSGRPTKKDAEGSFETVQQEWMLDLPLKMQTTLMANIRGVDSNWAPGVKAIGRWMRSCMLKNGGGEGDKSDFMAKQKLPILDGDLEREIEYLPVHYYHHAILGLEILAYKHPDKPVRDIARYYYTGMVGMLHMNPETEEEMNWRLEDQGEVRDAPPDPPTALHKHNSPPAPPPVRRSSY